MSVYMGRLECGDPLFGYLARDVMPRCGGEVREPVFHVSRLPGSNIVYKYHEEHSRLSLIGKFYHFNEPGKAMRLKSEFDNLNRARALGLTAPPNSVVRPLGKDDRMGLGLVEEYSEGCDLDHYVRRAIYDGEGGRLKVRLSELAFFLAELHGRTREDRPVDLGASSGYFRKVLGKLARKGLVDDERARAFLRLEARWLERDLMRADSEVTIHGDATPTNFLFPRDSGVVAIDLERMRPGDRMFDVGMVCGELKHAFMWRTGNKYAAERYISHFIDEYARRFGGGKFLRAVARRNPFYMALTELRIARNRWLDRGHRAWLVREAGKCLEWGLKVA